MSMNNYFPILNIDLKSLISNCSSNIVSDDSVFYLFSMLNRINIHEIFRYQKFNDDFNQFLTVYNNGLNVVGKIGPSYEAFLLELINILNVKDTSIKEGNMLTDKFLERLFLLDSISSYQELSKEFPVLYKDLINGRNYINKLEYDYKQCIIPKDIYEADLKYYYSCGLKRGFNNFIKTQTNMYSRYIERRFQYREYIKYISYGKTIRYYFDVDKMIMYIIDKYLSICEESDNEYQIKFYLSLINKYLDSSYDKSIYLHNDDIEINIYTIRNRVNNIIKKLNGNKTLIKKYQ